MRNINAKELQILADYYRAQGFLSEAERYEKEGEELQKYLSEIAKITNMPTWTKSEIKKENTLAQYAKKSCRYCEGTGISAQPVGHDDYEEVICQCIQQEVVPMELLEKYN